MCQILQSVRLLLQSVSGITKCDRLLLQSATVITKWDVTRDCPKSMISDNGKKKKNSDETNLFATNLGTNWDLNLPLEPCQKH